MTAVLSSRAKTHKTEQIRAAMDEFRKQVAVLCCKTRHREEEDPTTKKEEEPKEKIAKLLAKWGKRDGTPAEEVDLAALKFTARTGVIQIEDDPKPMSKRHKKQMRLLLRDNFPYLGGEGLVKKG